MAGEGTQSRSKSPAPGSSRFPDPSQSSVEGVVALGRDLKVETLLDAYSHGIFPWPHPGYPLLWFCPEERGVLFFDELHVPRSLAKFIKKSDWRVTINQSFPEVIRACQKQVRPGQNGTWITEKILSAYQDLHRAGYAVSAEVWAGEELVGGIYGVWHLGVFSGESMFYSRSNASKVALLGIIDWLKTQGADWMDIQMLTSVTEQLGGRYLPRSEFLRLLKASQRIV